MKIIISLVLALLTVSGVWSEEPPAAEAAAVKKEVALMLDDGPHPVNSPWLLEILQQEGVRVSLAQIGEKVERYPELTRAAAEAGHQIINHSMTHGRIAEMNDAELRDEMLLPLAVFEAATGHAPGVYWPPFIASDARMPTIAEEGGMYLLLPAGFAFTSSDDWDVRGTPREAIVSNALKGLDDPELSVSGDRRLILFHEWREDTLRVLPEIIAALKARGYRFITIDELLAGAEPASNGKK